MMADDSLELLRRFESSRSESAFRDLVRLHSPLVYATALRRLNGDRAGAEDVTQEVFSLLARKASTLRSAPLPVWLHRQTCRRAANHMRTEKRRRKRELVSAQAMSDTYSSTETHESITVEVDEAMLDLPSADRELLIHRYFEERDLRTLGGRLGISEDAARKRIERALEKLAAIMKRRGVPVGGASLGGTMSGFGSSPLPHAVVSQISTRALESMAVGSGSTFTSIFKSFLCGVILTSLVGTAALLTDQSGSRPRDGQTVTLNEKSRREPPLQDPGSSTLDLISRIKRTMAGPDHAMTTLRLNALLDSVGFDEIPAFIAEANTRLTLKEQEACYLPLLKRWQDSDPQAASAFALKFASGLSSPGFGSTDMVRFLLHNWEHRDLPAFSAWLNENWDQPTMANSTFSGSVRTYFAIDISDTLLRDHSAAEAFAYLRTIPDEQAVKSCLKAMTGEEPHASAWMNMGPDQLLELYREFSRLPDSGLAARLKLKFWENLSQHEPGHVETMLASMNAREHFEATLPRIGKYSKQVSREQTPGGERMRFETVDNAAQGEADAMKAGLEAGLSRAEILQQIGTAIVMKNVDALAWLERHRGEFDADPILLAKIGDTQRNNQGLPGIPPSEGGMLSWALHLQDPELRTQLTRAGFRLMLAESPERAARFLSSPNLPEDLKAELSEIMSPSAP
ncbi:RNA polymerase sigma factor [Luteolibacter luteus]|uniref:Sigma-70 family RNA polymerase sigma factor n=1 Tax=Luteolibacter luteus TaxID=2728835 RepID=A0A858RN07_9BACT|nr:sigma-70 family RNA polymerase sigma factor [Luteolibacter luteus]QJE98095.1 sigma-70 family RNA polymerase sigma factor [Luteolibacter luteus]